MQTVVFTSGQFEQLKREVASEVTTSLCKFLKELLEESLPKVTQIDKNTLREPMSKKEVAQILDIKPKSVNKRCERKQIPFHTGDDGKIYFERHEIIEYILKEKGKDVN